MIFNIQKRFYISKQRVQRKYLTLLDRSQTELLRTWIMFQMQTLLLGDFVFPDKHIYLEEPFSSLKLIQAKSF